MASKVTYYCPPIDRDKETLIPVFDAKSYPSRRGRHPAKSAIYRWYTAGLTSLVPGVRRKLATVHIGGALMTSLEAIRRFNDGPQVELKPKTNRVKQLAAELEAAGL